MAQQERDLNWLRRQIVIALAAYDDLFQLLVLKGGNALALAHRIGMRASLDLDYSMSEETESDEQLGIDLLHALSDHLARHGLIVFDWSFKPRPKSPKDDQDKAWGGYLGEFKVIETRLWSSLGGDIEQARKEAWGITAGGGAPRKFRLELSRNEYCEGAGKEHIGDGFDVRVYTPAMIAVEKLRSICQQMREYEHSTKRKARARDFYDIHAIVSEADVNLLSSANIGLLRAVFAAKDVPLNLLSLVEEEIDFHEGEWDDVRNSIPAGRTSDFRFYADFVVRIVKQLARVIHETVL